MRYYKGLAALLALTLSFPTMLEIQTKAAEESETETTLEELEETSESEDTTEEVSDELEMEDILEIEESIELAS